MSGWLWRDCSSRGGGEIGSEDFGEAGDVPGNMSERNVDGSIEVLSRKKKGMCIWWC